ncbi:Fic family protein [Streptomyces sp. LE64]|uniref:Fic family protein n=1 Tax=Streptomyces sp. LE64 TaxID=3448653 RepID=UPI0040431C88
MPCWAAAPSASVGCRPSRREDGSATASPPAHGPGSSAVWPRARPDPPLPSRAARTYLDVLFFHPFADGNARAAMLALAFVLAREGALLDRVRPLQTTRWADDAEGAADLAVLLGILLTAAKRRPPLGKQCRTGAPAEEEKGLPSTNEGVEDLSRTGRGDQPRRATSTCWSCPGDIRTLTVPRSSRHHPEQASSGPRKRRRPHPIFPIGRDLLTLPELAQERSFLLLLWT